MYKKIYFAICMILFLISSAFAASFEKHEKNFALFENSIIDVANKITWSGKHNFQDVEFVENEMEGDETVYARAWYDDYYLVIRKYTNKTWSKSFALGFWTSSEELTFAKGIKVGSSINDVKAFFGKKHVSQQSPSSKKYNVYRVSESDTAGQIVFSTENNRITSIGYENWYNMTSKMSFLFSLYVNLTFAEVTGEKVNVRDYFPKGEVLFQVNRSKKDYLLVDAEYPGNGWCYVKGKINHNLLKPILRSCYISKQFLKIRELSISERKLFLSQYIKSKK